MFPFKLDCIKYLEQLRWSNQIKCPYCKSKYNTSFKRESRYHCNTCFTSFSVMIGTVLHNTKLDLRKWFAAIVIIVQSDGHISCRNLAKKLDTNRNTCNFINQRINKLINYNKQAFQSLVEAYVIEQIKKPNVPLQKSIWFQEAIKFLLKEIRM
ncbi:transposase [Priestia sp. LL-8]|uniref:transposase n=1 Tax=Priestia sp. LL-8 TaxID=3110068 RepID=UPI003FA77DBC